MARKRRSKEIKYEKVVKSDTDDYNIGFSTATLLFCYFLVNSISLIIVTVLGMDALWLAMIVCIFNTIIMLPLFHIINEHFETRKVYYRRIKE